MSAFSPEQQDELTRLIQMQVARSDLATLVRQLQGGASFPADAGKRRAVSTVTVTWPGGSATSGSTAIPHPFTAPPRVLAFVQDQAGVGAAYAWVSQGSGQFFVLVTTAGGMPTAGTTSIVTVVYWEP